MVCISFPGSAESDHGFVRCRPLLPSCRAVILKHSVHVFFWRNGSISSVVGRLLSSVSVVISGSSSSSPEVLPPSPGHYWLHCVVRRDIIAGGMFLPGSISAPYLPCPRSAPCLRPLLHAVDRCHKPRHSTAVHTIRLLMMVVDIYRSVTYLAISFHFVYTRCSIFFSFVKVCNVVLISTFVLWDRALAVMQRSLGHPALAVCTHPSFPWDMGLGGSQAHRSFLRCLSILSN